MKFSHFLFRFFWFSCFLCGAISPLFAQPETDFVLPRAGNAPPQWARLEGTIESKINDVTARAKISIQGPGQMRVEILQDDAARIAPQIVVAVGNETRVFDPTTKRIARLPHSLLGLRDWNLQAGGPANFSLSNFADGLNLPAEGKLERKGFVQSFVSDYVRFGGGGDRIFYAPFKRTSWDGAARVVLEWKGAGPVQTRTEFDDAGAILSRATITYDKSGLPQNAVVTDAKNRVLAEFKYNLKPVAEPFSAQTFSFDFAAGQIVEDAQIKEIKEYSGADASSKWNRGAALLRQAEELPAAFAAWGEAARLEPKATAPHFAIYDAALASRDLALAEMAMAKLAELLGPESFPVVWRRAGVLLARRDWAGAQNALEAAVKIEPQNLQARLSLADVLRSRGDFEKAQVRLLEILKSAHPQNAVQAQAAQLLAELASGKSGSGVLQALEKESPPTPWQSLAGAIIALRQGQSPQFETENLDALGVLAVEFERAGKDNEALAAWQKIIARAPSPLDQNARAHMVAIFARRGDATSSLAQYRELIAATPDLKTRRAWQEQLISAWRKAFRQEQLKIVLGQRTLSTNASPDDARLWLIYQENFGTADDVAEAIKNGLARFTRDAWWRARQAELIMDQAAQGDNITLERLQREALRAADEAVALDPSQPYYAIGRALILTQRATPVTGVYESGRYDGEKKAANDALDALLKKWPDDPDVQIAVASQRLALEKDGAHAPSTALLETALRGGAPGAGEDRHFISFSSRQVLISALRRDSKWNEIAPQYPILFRASRSGDEQVGVALNELRLLMKRGEPQAIADRLLFFARESWPFDESQQVLVPLLNVVAVKESLLAPVLLALQNSPDPYARFVLAKLYGLQTREARRVLAAPQAPDRAERDLIAASNNLKSALKELIALVDGGDKILASRAAATLGEEAMNARQLAEGEKWLARAIVFEPREVSLRVALARALLAQNKVGEALAVRDEMLRALPHTFDNLYHAAKLSSQIADNADKEFTARLANHAANVGAASSEIPSGPWQLASYVAARANFDAGKIGAATEIYNGLMSAQWSIIERAVAMIDLEESFKSADRAEQAAKVAQHVEALGLSPQQRARAEDIWTRLNQ